MPFQVKTRRKPLTKRNFRVAAYNAGFDSDNQYSATYDDAIQTLVDRLMILLGECHVVGINEISPKAWKKVLTKLPEFITGIDFGYHDAVLWHPL